MNFCGVRADLGVPVLYVFLFFFGVSGNSGSSFSKNYVSRQRDRLWRYCAKEPTSSWSLLGFFSTLRFLVAFVSLCTRSMRSRMLSGVPLNISSQTNSSVYVAVLVLHPRRQTNIFPRSLEPRGMRPLGYLAKNDEAESIVAFPLMEVKGLTSHEGEIYSSFLCGQI